MGWFTRDDAIKEVRAAEAALDEAKQAGAGWRTLRELQETVEDAARAANRADDPRDRGWW